MNSFMVLWVIYVRFERIETINTFSIAMVHHASCVDKIANSR